VVVGGDNERGLGEGDVCGVSHISVKKG